MKEQDIPNSIIISRDHNGVIYHSYWTTTQQLIPFEETKFIRKEIMDETIKTAEDHAYFAGKENLREELLEWAKTKYDKAFRLYLKKGDNYHYGLGKMNAYQKLIDKINSL